MSPRRLLYHLSLITSTHYTASISIMSIMAYLDKLNQPYEELSLAHPGLRYLARRMKTEHKSPPALMYRNQIVSISTRFKAHQALLDWRLLEKEE